MRRSIMRTIEFLNRGWQYSHGVSGILASLLLFTNGCALTEHDKAQNVRTKVAHATLDEEAETTVSLLLPAGGDVRDHGLVAGGRLELRDRARTLSVAGAPLNLYNLGPSLGNTVQTTIGTWGSTTGAACGNLVSKNSVLLRDRARIAGNVITAGTIQKQNQVVIAGTQQPGAQIEAPLSLSWVQPLEADATKPAVNVWSGQSLTLEPGSYSQLAVYSTATLTLKSGSYAFSQFQLEPQSTLKLQIDPTQGPVILYVNDVLAWRGATSPASAEGLMLVYTGTQPIKFEKKVTMAVVAPNSDITLSTGGLTHAGSVYAKGIFLDPDVTFNYVPFKYWDWVMPPKPVANCVYAAGEGTYMAVFDYSNSQKVSISAPAGVNNAFIPASNRGISTLTSFQPGVHKQVVWVDMPSTGVTWDLYGQRATVNLNSPACDLRDSAVRTETEGDGRSFPPRDTPPGARPSQPAVYTENGLGAGRYFAAGSSDNSSSSA